MCYNKSEVNTMENHEEKATSEEQVVLPEKQGYKPRPAWQVWAARIGLVLFIVMLVIYYMVYFRGGR